jgi:hypothetical protein
MNKDEKLERICNDFSLLSEEQQDYILGIMQALVFAKSSYNQDEPENQPILAKN